MKQIIQTAFLAFALAAGPARAAVDIAGNWSDITFSSVGASGYSLSFQESGGNYSCFIDDYDLDFISYQASQVTFYPNTLHFHLDWAPPGGFSFDGFLSADGSTLNCVLSNSFGFFPQTVTREPSVANFLPAIFTNAGGSLPYRLFVPPQYQETNQYPLMLFLHGAGEAGVDNVIQLTDLIGELSFISVSNQLAHPCFYVAPQCPTNGTWVDATRRGQLPGLLAALEMQYHIDTNRIYVTGLSLGGFGAWDQITQNPSLYAAAVPLSGGGDPSLAP